MNELIRYLETISSEDKRRDTGALAALRRGLTMPPGTCAEMFPYVLPHLTPNEQVYDFPTYCLVAALFAYHSKFAAEGNMGDHMRIASKESTEATERRFTNLLRSHPDDLYIHLRQAVSYLKSKEVPVNWNKLLKDLLRWENDQMIVQKAWARGYWGYLKAENNQEENKQSKEE